MTITDMHTVGQPMITLLIIYVAIDTDSHSAPTVTLLDDQEDDKIIN